MTTERDRKSSIERAKATGLVLAGAGLNALLPGAGTISLRLGQHVMDLVTANRLAKLEDFHRKVFEEAVSEDEVNDRFHAMEDDDFQHLVVAMLQDIEREKVAVYSSIYIHLVENSAKFSKSTKQGWIHAASLLRLSDYAILRDNINGNRRSVGPASHRLASVGAFELVANPPADPRLSGPQADIAAHATEFGEELYKRLKAVLPE
ncbi:MAG: hypothetical protein JNK04_22280 [Myxococcales bacterium]|nr:hypothetical protein [Myxococcales bacterium]